MLATALLHENRTRATTRSAPRCPPTCAAARATRESSPPCARPPPRSACGR
jgi:hypothetical protein